MMLLVWLIVGVWLAGIALAVFGAACGLVLMLLRWAWVFATTARLRREERQTILRRLHEPTGKDVMALYDAIQKAGPEWGISPTDPPPRDKLRSN